MMEYENEFSTLFKPLYISLKKLKCKPIESKSEIHCDESKYIKDSSNQKDDQLHDHSIYNEISKNAQRRNSNKGIQKYICSHLGCNKLFGKYSRLVVHERIHTGDRPFICKYENCDRSYTRQFHLTRHIAVSHEVVQQTSKESYRCEKCNKGFSNCYSLKKHEKQIHKDKRYACQECGQLFRKQQHLKTHSFVHTGIKPYSCKYPGCESRFNLPSVLKRHVLSHVKGRYNCPYDECSQKFDVYTELRTHLSEGHPKICEFCGKEFSMLSRLKTHLPSHTEVREAFFCPFTPCERYYFEEKNLRNHICCKHNENFKGFTCRLCDKSLVTKQKLKLHMISHDPNKSNVEKPRRKTPRKPRKDKGVSRTDYAELLSGYPNSREEAFHEEMQESDSGVE